MSSLRAYAIDGIRPRHRPTAYVHPSAVLIGDVIIGPGLLRRPCASLRGDFGRLILEARRQPAGYLRHAWIPGHRHRGREDGHIGHGAVLLAAVGGRMR